MILQKRNADADYPLREYPPNWTAATEQQKALFNVVTKIRASLDLETIFRTTAQEVGQLLEVDRVVVYRFNPDWSGAFVAEWMTTGWDSLLEKQEIEPKLRENVSDCQLQRAAAFDRDTYLAELQGGCFTQGELVLVRSDIYQAGFSECYIEALERFQTRAYVIAGIYHHQTLWGLLAAFQNAEPRDWEPIEVQFMTQLAAQLAVAIQQAELLLQTQQQAAQLTQTLTYLQKTQTQLIQAEKMSSLGQLVAGVAHEINNPVNFIYGNLVHVNNYANDMLQLVRLYQQACPHPPRDVLEQAATIDLDFLAEDLPKLLVSMQLGAERIREIVLSLRNFSRLDQADLKAINLHEGIDSTLLILQYRLKAKANRPGIEVVKDYGDLPKVECYAGQLNQVFMNLLTNAIDSLEARWVNAVGDALNERRETFTPTIHIHTALVAPDRVAIHIRDNGLGIPEAVSQHLFDPFFTTKPMGKGTGLGLSISYQIIVDTHGGSLRCHSMYGQGATFSIELPTSPSETGPISGSGLRPVYP